MQDRETLETYVDATARLLDLSIAAEHRPGVLQYMALAAGLAQQVMSFPLALHDESGSVFQPVAAPTAPPQATGQRP